MDIQARKISFVQEFLKLNSEEAIVSLEEVLKRLKSQSKKEMKPMSMKELNERVDRALDDAENGRVLTLDELRKDMASWS